VSKKAATLKGLTIKPFFTDGEIHPFELIDWEQRDAIIPGKEKPVFLQKKVNAPVFWSDQALSIVASRYFKGTGLTRETGIDEMIRRVANTISKWGLRQGYFKTSQDAKTFNYELCFLLVHQMMSLNSPVWFNVGVKEKPQTSACFILSIQDNMEDIAGKVIVEIKIFRWGSGCGSNRSALRGSMESISEGGTASGPTSFILIYDQAADVVKSGGKMRRAAKMEILDIDHPDIVSFINLKAQQERTAHNLIDLGYTPEEAYGAVRLQNTNTAIRLSDDFMKSVSEDGTWTTKLRISKSDYEVFKARDLLMQIAQANHFCGDPGVQFHDAINRYNTCAASGTIIASNPCSEFMFLDDSACNLASLNLMKFRNVDGSFKIKEFVNAVHITILAQDILINNSSFPTKAIEVNSRVFRPLGMGYTNLGSFLTSNGLTYGSKESCAVSAAITSLMTSQAYATSREIAEHLAPFDEYEKNKQSFMHVLEQHFIDSKVLEQNLGELLKTDKTWTPIITTANTTWASLINHPKKGFRNAQVTLLAPTGTISLMMDAETTGVEPPLDIVVEKQLVGGGSLKLLSKAYLLALEKLGYTPNEIEEIETKLKQGVKIPALGLKLKSHEDLFSTALGERAIPPESHLLMLSAIQKFLSGSISKTVSLQHSTPPEKIYDLLIEAWKLGLKSVTFYRDGAKRLQPLKILGFQKPLSWGDRRKLPTDRNAICHEFSVAGRKGFLHIGHFEDGTPGEIFIRVAKEGSLTSGVLDMAATAISFALQYGCPLEKIVDKFAWTRYEPAGITNNPKIRFAYSIGDYIFRHLGQKYLESKDMKKVEDARFDASPNTEDSNGNGEVNSLSWKKQQEVVKALEQEAKSLENSPICPKCDAEMRRAGNCFLCSNCGNTSGVCS